MSLILKELPIGVTQTRPLFRLANLFRNIILHTKTKCKNTKILIIIDAFVSCVLLTFNVVHQ